MRSHEKRLSLVSLTGVMLTVGGLIACSEDTNAGGSGGMGAIGGGAGASGAAGAGGMAGSAGAGGAAGSAGTAGTAGGAGTAGSGGAGSGASAQIAASTMIHNPAPMIAGSGTFVEADGMVTLELSVTNCPAGMHGFHIHEGTECGEDGAAAAMHWDPLMAGAHGQVNDPAPHHAGDAGMIECDAMGNGTFSITTSEWSLMADSNINPTTHAVILHGLDAAQRIACGVIEADGAGAKFALSATTLSANPEPNITGTANFTTTAGGETALHVQLTACAKGEHGFHIHAGTECGPDGALAMAHWDPLNAGVHGQVNDPAPHHAGDAGMIMCAEDGTGTLDITTKEWTLMTGENLNPVGHAVIVHGVDPANRVACGVIKTN